MPRLLTMTVFVGVLTTITGAVHYYIWARLVRDPVFSATVTRWLSLLVVVLFASVPLSFWLSRSLPPEHGKLLLLLSYTWMGLMFYLLVSLASADLTRGVYYLGLRVSAFAGRATWPLGAEQRLGVARLLAMVVAATATILSAAALVGAARAPRVQELKLTSPRLPPALDGTVLAAISDLHVGPTLRREFLEDVVRRVNGLNPDAVLIVGDFADGSVSRLGDTVAPLRELRARWGVYFVTGNHEFYQGADAWCAELRRLGVHVLRGELVSLGNGRESFDLVGVDDWEARRFGNPPTTDLGQILRGRSPDRELVLLAHQPKAVLEAQHFGVGLQISGHTHGGQLWPWGTMVKLQQPVVHGLARYGDTFVYVSNGTGYWGPPMRLGAPAEIVKVVLHHGSGKLDAELVR